MDLYNNYYTNETIRKIVRFHFYIYISIFILNRILLFFLVRIQFERYEWWRYLMHITICYQTLIDFLSCLACSSSILISSENIFYMTEKYVMRQTRFNCSFHWNSGQLDKTKNFHLLLDVDNNFQLNIFYNYQIKF